MEDCERDVAQKWRPTYKMLAHYFAFMNTHKCYDTRLINKREIESVCVFIYECDTKVHSLINFIQAFFRDY